MTLKEMRDEVRARIAEADTTFFTDAEVNGWLNAGQLDLAQRLPAEALHTLREVSEIASVTDQQAYSLPADFLKWRGVSYKGTPCRMVGFEELRAVIGGNSFWVPTDADPAAFVWKTLDIYPTPDADGETISLYYVKQPAKMTVDGAECPMPKELHEAVVFYACAIANAKDQNYEASAFYRQAYQDVLAQYAPIPQGGA